MLTFDANVPQEVRAWASNQVARRGKTDEVAARITRLVQYPLMSSRWMQLVSLAREHATFNSVEFSTRAVSAPSYWRVMNKDRGSTVDTVTVKISKAAETLASLLTANRELLHYWLEYDIDTASLLRDAASQSSEPLINTLYVSEVETFLRTLDPAIEEAGLGRYFPDIAALLATLAARMKQIVDNEETLLRPTRANAEGADRTYTVRVLSHYLRHTTRRPMNALVAAVVNAIYDDPDEGLDTNNVRAMTTDLARVGFSDIRE